MTTYSDYEAKEVALDRHVRRSGEDYAEAFLRLLPQGQAWPRNHETTLYKAVRGWSEYWGFVDSRIADLLERESDPRTTLELLPDWERAWGLPDPCYQAPPSIAARQRELYLRMTMLGEQSRQFFIDVAHNFLGLDITITEYRTFVVGMDRCGDNRVFGNARFTETITAGSIQITGKVLTDDIATGALASTADTVTAGGQPLVGQAITPTISTGADPMLWSSTGYNEFWNRPVLNPLGIPVMDGERSEWPYYGIGPETNRFYWTVHVAGAQLIWFRCGGSQCGIDHHLRIVFPDDLECLFERWKPAHTQIIFDYSGVTVNVLLTDEDGVTITDQATVDIIVDAF